jgi:uncharacterized protein (DUF302 family)
MDSLAVSLTGDYDQIIERVTKALQSEGFGVLTRIDLDKAFKDKLGVDFRRYAILGACNPKLAHTAVTADPEVGLLLPCNVTVEEMPDRVQVRFVDPEAMMSMGKLGEKAAVKELAADAKSRLTRAMKSLEVG